MNIALFILPNESLNKEIILWKQKASIIKLQQMYNNHPPHMTIINLNINSLSNVIQELTKLFSTIKKFKIEVNKSDVFYNDTATNGGHTLYFKSKPNDSLYSLQLKIAEKLIQYKIKSDSKYNFNKINLINNYNKYGFPFIGNVWIPHFTITSIQTHQKNIFIEKFLSYKINYSINVNKISLWEITGDNHNKLEEFNLS
tara:strand:- start:670 stop:1266 length:597 start_codon:yes stop_codon:yes gene_type:complete